ncbi:uncharacterized protein LAESUDRAFT_816283 [Laetiporus sulphureus 93-53]|uniref:Uncharacterized protein n=1 Tax=Laetiporus sulphureus 93-53 TaxID=1314785 RepID=A0A165BDP4_9APHY|nr:uncharacterized protein LAESUDRAFT_816283 [Laetiporus sulphureus 93-53]KZT00816.1 hypothetical protein LAESUDRAFT_816283 [Laetiporus sulphureus 93-53]
MRTRPLPIDPNTLSELENSSDSDWLDVASSRASEDTDSVVGFDSDRELGSDRPPSRRSTNSAASSRDEVHIWQGLLEGVESHVAPLALTTRLVALSSDDILPPDAEAPDEAHDPEEEQRVREALDQSMASTLSGSRGSSSLSGSHTSIVHSRDLRLSFPDPLNSPRDEPLNISFEDVAPPSEADVAPTVSTDASLISAPDSGPAPVAADLGEPATPAVPEDDVRPDFYVVLYGASSAVKWSLVDQLLDKAAKGSHYVLTSKIVGLIDGYVRFMSSDHESLAVSVIDRTELSDGDKPSCVPLERPSLAVVFLPAPPLSLPEHTLYLPVVAQRLSMEGVPHSADQLFDAEQQWETLHIPRNKVARLSPFYTVIEREEVERSVPRYVARVLRPLFARSDRKPAQTFPSRHALTILAVLSVVLGYLIKRSFGPSIISTEPGVSQPVGHIAVSANASLAGQTALSSALVPSSLKEFALAVLPAPLVASTSSGDVSQAPHECACGCGLVSWPGKVKDTTDIMVRPTTLAPALRDTSKTGLALLAAQTHGHEHGNSKGKGKAVARAEEPLYALSMRLADSVSEYFDLRAVSMTVVRELQDIVDVLRELAHEIRRQTAARWQHWTGIAHGLRAQVMDRHGRARTKAQELRQMGGRLAESVRGRVGAAKENARLVKDVWQSDAWRSGWEGSRVRQLAQERKKARRLMRQAGFNH